MRDAERAGLPAIAWFPIGSLRRFAPDVGDVSLLAVAEGDRHAEVLGGFARLSTVASIVSRSATHITLINERGAITLRVAAPGDAGSALVWYTGSRTHIGQLQARAERRGLVFHNARLTDGSGTALLADSEAALYGHLDLPEILPELREGGSEIEAAEQAALPALVGVGNIRGDLHMHSTWSDGRDSIEQMVVAAQQLGYEYVAITDHSERSLASRQLAAVDIPAQRAEIERVRQRVRGMEVLHGIEVDIMADGSLDFEDAVLERFDIVLASLHDAAGHDSAMLTERYLRAIRHPLVNVITHPANRSPARFDGYRLDFDTLFAAAAQTGTAMEIDGAPGHLDLDGLLARRAAAAGVTLVIDSDCHRSDGLGRQMRFGIGTARRGWVTPGQVLNTRPLEQVRSFIARKRERR